jgi:hypothetical protein
MIGREDLALEIEVGVGPVLDFRESAFKTGRSDQTFNLCALVMLDPGARAIRGLKDVLIYHNHRDALVIS